MFSFIDVFKYLLPLKYIPPLEFQDGLNPKLFWYNSYPGLLIALLFHPPTGSPLNLTFADPPFVWYIFELSPESNQPTRDGIFNGLKLSSPG